MPDAEVASSATPTTESPILTPAVKSGDFAAFEREERARETSPTKPAASSAAVVEDPPASTDATPKPASELAPPKPEKPKKNADSRVEELLADRARERERADRYERELEALRKPPTKEAASAPAAKPATERFPDYAEYLTEHPDAPLNDYLDARDEWRDTRRAAQTAERETANALDQTIEAQHSDLRKQFDEATKADPQFLEKLDPDVSETKRAELVRAEGGRVTPANIMASEVLKSHIAPQLSLYFSEHKDEWTRLQQVPDRIKAMPPLVQAREHVEWIKREIGRIEGKIEASAVTTTTTPKPKVSSAPAPGTSLGSRPSAGVDTEAEAMKRGDFATVEKIWRERDAAAIGRR